VTSGQFVHGVSNYRTPITSARGPASRGRTYAYRSSYSARRGYFAERFDVWLSVPLNLHTGVVCTATVGCRGGALRSLAGLWKDPLRVLPKRAESALGQFERVRHACLAEIARSSRVRSRSRPPCQDRLRRHVASFAEPGHDDRRGRISYLRERRAGAGDRSGTSGMRWGGLQSVELPA